jgi:flagellar M-ring protein FliF
MKGEVVHSVQVWLKQVWERAVALREKNRLAFNLACGFLGAIVFAAAAVWTYSSGESSVLASNLSPADMKALEMRLRRHGISYVAGQDWIRVSNGNMAQARELLLSSPGFSGGQAGFGLFDRPALGASDFVEQIAYQRALQGELERTIMDMRSIENARVMLAITRASPFALAPTETSHASVMLTPVAGAIIDAVTARSIAHLVASSLPGLRPEQVSVAVNDGSVLFPPQNDTGFFEQTALRQKMERALENKAEQILQKIMGPGRYVVQVSVELDERKRQETMHLYGAGGKPAVLSEEHNQEPITDKTALGIPGLTSNLPPASALPTAANSGTASASSANAPATSRPAPSAPVSAMSPVYSRRDIVNYRPSSRDIQESHEAFGVKRISVAAVVDGIYKGGVFQAQSEERLNEIKDLLSAAVGGNPARGDIVEVKSAALAHPYVPPPPSFAEQLRGVFNNLLYVGVAAFLGLAILVLSIWLAVRAIGKRRLAGRLKKQISEISDAAKPPESVRIEAKPDQDLRLRVNLEAERNPEAVAAVLRKWMDEGNLGAGGSHPASGGLSEAA